MTFLIELAWRSSVVLTVGLVLAWGLRHRSAALRHAVLAACLLATLAVMPLRAVMPSIGVPLPFQPAAQAVTTDRTTAVTPSVGVPSLSATEQTRAPRQSARPLVIIWAVGVGVSAALLMASLYRVRTLARRGMPPADPRWRQIAGEVARRRGLAQRFELVQTAAPDMLATTGVWRHRVLLPATADRWPESRIRIVISHELAHIERRDWTIKIAAEIARAMLWFNPLVWVACRRLGHEAEHACDDIVLGGGVAPRDYAADLLAVARLGRRGRQPVTSTLSMANPSTLERRISAMLNPALDRTRPSRRLVAACAGLLVTVTFAIAAVGAQQQAAPSTLSGILYDQTGAVLPGVAVTLEDANKAKSTAQSNATGRVDFPNVAAGRYVLSAGLPGFKAFRQELELRDSRDWDRVITLQLGELSESISVRSTRTTAAPAAQPQMPAPVRVGGNIRVPKKLVDVKPMYPESMRAAGREATVKIDAVIDKTGSVSFARVLNADIHPDFAVAAVDAVRQWKFSPTMLNGVPVDVAMVVSVAFSLGN
jgi:TonB family protein